MVIFDPSLLRALVLSFLLVCLAWGSRQVSLVCSKMGDRAPGMQPEAKVRANTLICGTCKQEKAVRGSRGGGFDCQTCGLLVCSDCEAHDPFLVPMDMRCMKCQESNFKNAVNEMLAEDRAELRAIKRYLILGGTGAVFSLIYLINRCFLCSRPCAGARADHNGESEWRCAKVPQGVSQGAIGTGIRDKSEL